ncbi:MAG: hypothetical protein BM557_02705 [Flavobacterium sp. MedPE-SWcel]|uniref:hypothetical protein n=1 Tax=uncultured Flavobacterium sp. TaxID=165435 RepID=UPI00090F0D5D|nr:hypothetical protein [uncultured Flavobacterium sp.]OIQ21724.1 MAG: hypothetical protein BM557_02705 [Flavobacterium sp. MedPE-SWcel]
MKKTLVLFSLFLISSCQWFDQKVPDKEELVNKRLEEINWKEVSSYPSIADCDAITDKEQQKECFFESMIRLVQEKLDADTIAVLYPELDTISVQVTVFADSRLEFEPRFEQDSVSYNKAVIDSILKSRLVDFPQIEPAQKEGIPVTTQFTLPVILNVE